MRLTLVLLLLAVCLTLWFIVKLQPSSAGAFGFAVVWLNTPYAVMARLLFVLQRRGSTLLPWCIAVVLVVAAGLGMFLDAIYWHPDPQSVIAVVLTPLLQGFIFLVGAPLAWWAGRRFNHCNVTVEVAALFFLALICHSGANVHCEGDPL